MDLFHRIEADLVAARKMRDELTLATLGLLKSEVVKASKEPGAEGIIDDELVLRVLRRELKRREEAVQLYRQAGRQEAAGRELAEAEVLRGYLPPQLSEEELEREVRAVIEEVGAQGPKDLGRVVRAAGQRLGGRAESGRIAATARRLLPS